MKFTINRCQPIGELPSGREPTTRRFSEESALPRRGDGGPWHDPALPPDLLSWAPMDGERCAHVEDAAHGGGDGDVRLHGLKQPPYNTTMMGVVKGALDYYGISRTPGEAFVLSGHAFLMNVHEELCPSGPYLWRYDRFFELLTNLGLAMQNAGTLTATADPARRAALEERLRGAPSTLASSVPC